MDTGAETQSSRINPERIRKSASYRSALARSAKVLKKPEKLTRLINEAIHKASKVEKGPLTEAKENLFALFRMLKVYATGDYREISWSNLVLVVAAIVYFVMPVDLIPDIITALGYFDDAAILTWTINSIGHELEKFKAWESSQAAMHSGIIEMAED